MGGLPPWTAAAAWPIDLMRFTLNYDGPLHSQQDDGPQESAKRAAEKWSIRRQINPQMAKLWRENKVLQRAHTFARVPEGGSSFTVAGRHTSPIEPSGPVEDGWEDLFGPISIGTGRYVPLIRESMALACKLDILFLRDDETGFVIKNGDLDNRIKVFLDGLTVPPKNDTLHLPGVDPDPFYCLMENDALVDDIHVRSGRLLLPAGNDGSVVRLVIDVTVTVTFPTPYNIPLLG